MSAATEPETITFYGLAKAAYAEAAGDSERASEILIEQIERNDPPYAVLRLQLLRPAIREELQKVKNGIRARLWSGVGSSSVGFDRPMPEPLVEDAPPPDPAPPPPQLRALRVIEAPPRPPTIAAPTPQTGWAPNEALADRMETYARKTMLEYPVGRMGLLGDLTINQVREAGMVARRQRRDSTIMEAFFGLVAKDRPGYQKVRDLYTAEQLDDLKREATAIAGAMRLPR